VIKPFHPASNFCLLISIASKSLGFADFTNFPTVSFFRRLLRPANVPIAQLLRSRIYFRFDLAAHPSLSIIRRSSTDFYRAQFA
jgi:hypothetical protein